MDLRIDLNKELVQNPDSTFFGRVRGRSMEGEGFREGDLLVIDRSKPFVDGAIACCCVDGEFTIKRIRKHKEYLELLPSNPAYPSLRVNPEQEFLVWGIVIHHIRMNL